MKKYFCFLLILVLINCSSSKKNGVDQIFNEQNAQIKFEGLIQRKNNILSIHDLSLWIDNIKKLFLRYKTYKELTIFLGTLTFKDNNNDLKAFIDFYISDVYWQHGEKDVAVFYMLKVPKEKYPINYNFKPIGYYIAKRIIKTDSTCQTKAMMHNILLNEYKEIIDVPFTLYELSNLYKKELDINNAVKAMQKLVNEYYSNENFPENININFIVKEISFHKSKKYWIHQDLETLINNIKYAVRKKNFKSLYYYTSKKNFDIRLFQQKSSIRKWSYGELEIHKRWTSRIFFADELEDYSSENEAFLKTKNWNFQLLRTWVFYFKKIEYPYDKNINGCWEWAGIYFGEPL